MTKVHTDLPVGERKVTVLDNSLIQAFMFLDRISASSDRQLAPHRLFRINSGQKKQEPKRVHIWLQDSGYPSSHFSDICLKGHCCQPEWNQVDLEWVWITWHESDNIYATVEQSGLGNQGDRCESLHKGQRQTSAGRGPRSNSLLPKGRNHELLEKARQLHKTVNCLNATMLPKELCVQKKVILTPFKSARRTLNKSICAEHGPRSSFTGISCGNCYFVAKPLRGRQSKVTQKCMCVCRSGFVGVWRRGWEDIPC